MAPLTRRYLVISYSARFFARFHFQAISCLNEVAGVEAAISSLTPIPPLFYNSAHWNFRAHPSGVRIIAIKLYRLNKEVRLQKVTCSGRCK